MPPVAAQTVNGPIHAVPCPWCQKKQDLRDHDDLLVDANEKLGEGDPGGAISFHCDDCTRTYRVVSVKAIKFVFVRQET